jgi:hypothetical protein
MSYSRKLLQGYGVLLQANVLAKALSLLALPLLTAQLVPKDYRKITWVIEDTFPNLNFCIARYFQK